MTLPNFSVIGWIQAFLPCREATLMMETLSMQPEQSTSETVIALKSLSQAVESLSQQLSAATTQNVTLLCSGLEQFESRLSKMQQMLEGLQGTLNSQNPYLNQQPYVAERWPEQYPPRNPQTQSNMPNFNSGQPLNDLGHFPPPRQTLISGSGS